jgi:hypothetical protein
MISLEEKYLIWKKAIEYLKKQNGKDILTNIVGETIYITNGKAKWDEVKNVILELEKYGVIETRPLWWGEYEVILKKK